MDEASKRALKRAREQDGLGTIEDMAAKMGITLDGPEPEAPPHWSTLPPLENEEKKVKVFRTLWKIGFKALAVVDYVGEWMGEALGITTPRYQYIINEVIAQQAEMDAEEEARRNIANEASAFRDKELSNMEAALTMQQPKYDTGDATSDSTV